MSKPNGTRGRELAAIFKNQLAECRAEIDLPVEGVPGQPDFKFRCVLRRLDFFTLIKNAKLPEHLARELMGASSAETLARAEEEAMKQARQMSIDDIRALNDFMADVAMKTCVEPRLVWNEPEAEDSIDLATCEIGPQLVQALYFYAMNLSPDVAVRLTNGTEAPLDAVATFRDGAELPNAGPDGAEQRPADKSVALSG